VSPGIGGYPVHSGFDFVEESIPQFGTSLLVIISESSCQIFLKEPVENDDH